MHVRLKFLQGSHSGKEIPVPTPKCVIGRGEECHLRTQTEAVSRRHCEILTTDNEVIVRDLNSRNGTFVNGERVAGDTVLLAGDVLRVGPVEFEALIEHTQSKAKRPKIADIKEAVARTAEGAAIPAKTELGDVGDWLDEADTKDKQRRVTDPDTRQFRLDETALSAADGKKAGDATIETKALPPEAKKPDKKKLPPGKLPPRPTTSSGNSRDAAADMLKKFFNRR